MRGNDNSISLIKTRHVYQKRHVDKLKPMVMIHYKAEFF